MRNRTTKQWSNWWKNRHINWKEQYIDTTDHPHRGLLLKALESMKWFSLFEIGTGAGANLINIVRHFKKVQVGGIDINKDAIETAKHYLQGALLKVGSAEDIMFSDNSVDVILTDMSLMYISPLEIDKVIKEMKRIGRNYVVLCELTSHSWWEQLKFFWSSGYHAHNYKKLLEKHEFWDIMEYKLPKEAWPGGDQEKIGYIIIARI